MDCAMRSGKSGRKRGHTLYSGWAVSEDELFSEAAKPQQGEWRAQQTEQELQSIHWWHSGEGRGLDGGTRMRPGGRSAHGNQPQRGARSK